MGSPLEPLEGPRPRWHLDLGPINLTGGFGLQTVGEYISFVVSNRVCGNVS